MEYYLYYRSWMYNRLYPGTRRLKPNFEEGVKGFIMWHLLRNVVEANEELDVLVLNVNVDI